jgi:hypothetical protein
MEVDMVGEDCTSTYDLKLIMRGLGVLGPMCDSNVLHHPLEPRGLCPMRLSLAWLNRDDQCTSKLLQRLLSRGSDHQLQNAI